MAPRDGRKREAREQRQERRSWTAALAAIAKRVVDPFGLFTARRCGGAAACADAAAAPDDGGHEAEGGPGAADANRADERRRLAGDADVKMAAAGEAEEADGSEDLAEAMDEYLAEEEEAAAAEAGGGGDYGGAHDQGDEEASMEHGREEVQRLQPDRERGREAVMPAEGAAEVARRRIAPRRRHRPLGGGRRVGGSSSAATRYPMDVFEDATSYEVQADVPGMHAADLAVEVGCGRLVLEGSAVERSGPVTLRALTPREQAAAAAAAPPGHTPRAVRTERRRRHHFKRTFRLPHDVDASAITASLHNGVLVVRLAKAARIQLDPDVSAAATDADGVAAQLEEAVAAAQSGHRRVRVDRLPSATVDPHDIAAATVMAGAAGLVTAAPPPPVPGVMDLASLPSPLEMVARSKIAREAVAAATAKRHAAAAAAAAAAEAQGEGDDEEEEYGDAEEGEQDGEEEEEEYKLAPPAAWSPSRRFGAASSDVVDEPQPKALAEAAEAGAGRPLAVSKAAQLTAPAAPTALEYGGVLTMEYDTIDGAAAAISTTAGSGAPEAAGSPPRGGGVGSVGGPGGSLVSKAPPPPETPRQQTA
ncbi:hypothetical protein GPECTOR_11g186 [Gonium pectorale]|uniref:SHSP domain-containing protein n=1 Tax=Gonium pectorale TaxID=33097 RepID=A0A150GPH8_GONPE|nr:hypothetical protein GPECTOR_11g186 [Gonium pectorale]|eukprot:KXZ51739.1 hypothetical protein GPECTOR_11g186 [Gonium pectorale]